MRLSVPSRFSFTYEVARRFLLATAGANKQKSDNLEPVKKRTQNSLCHERREEELRD